MSSGHEQLQEQLRMVAEGLRQQESQAREAAAQAQRRAEMHQSRGEQDRAAQEQLAARQHRQEAEKLAREAQNLEKVQIDDRTKQALAGNETRLENLQAKADVLEKSNELLKHKLEQQQQKHAEVRVPEKLDARVIQQDAALTVGLATGIAAYAAGKATVAAVESLKPQASERRVQEAIAKQPPASPELQAHNQAMADVQRADKERWRAAEEITKEKQARAVEIERTIRNDSEKQIARIQEMQADRFKEQASRLADAYKADPVKQQEMLAKLEQSRPQLKAQTDRLAEQERARAEQLVQETLKRENLLAAREAHERALERAREEKAREARNRDDR